VAERKPAFFERDKDTWIPLEACIGPWSPQHLHAGPVAAMCVALGEELQPGDDVVTTRLTLDLLRPVTRAPIVVETSTVKMGRRVGLHQISMYQEDKLTATARVQRTRQQLVSLPDLAGTGLELTPPDDRPEDFSLLVDRPEGRPLAPFLAQACDLRMRVPEAFFRPVSSEAWLRVHADLIAGIPLSTAAAVAAAADCGNALGAPVALDDPPMLFPNADLTIHLARAPEDAWVRMAPTSTWLDHGIGQTCCALSDRRGMLGTSVVTLPLANHPG